MTIFQLFFLGNIGKENVLYDILETKNDFLSYQNNNLKTVEKLTFFHGFGPKMIIFPTFVLGNIGQENVFYLILERENAFPGYKKGKFKKSKKLTFLQRG